MRGLRNIVVLLSLMTLVFGEMGAAALAAALYTYEVVEVYPHDPKAFTQGLVIHQGRLYEGTGIYGRSSLREVDLETGRVVREFNLSPNYFGEGIAILSNRIYQLTWLEHVGFIYDLDTFEMVGEFHYPTDGWGLTTDGTYLIMSDGSSTLYFLDSETFDVVRQIEVIDGNERVRMLNELEYVAGKLYANVWLTDKVVIIDSQSGKVEGWVDFSGLLNPESVTQPVDVLNGIAYDPETEMLVVTGKLWPELYQVQLVELQSKTASVIIK